MDPPGGERTSGEAARRRQGAPGQRAEAQEEAQGEGPPSAALVLEREADANLANHFSSVQVRPWVATSAAALAVTGCLHTYLGWEACDEGV